MADDDDDIDDASFWTVRLQKVERASSDEPEPDGENLFVVTFEAAGPTMSADLEVTVSDVADESQVVVEALDRLQDGLETWARLLGRRKGAEPIVPRDA